MLSSASLCRLWQDIATWNLQAPKLGIIAGYVRELNQNKDLYDALAHSLRHYERLASSTQASSSSAESIQSKGAEIEGYTSEAVMVGRLLLQDFEKAGIHLPEKQRSEISQVTAEVAQLGMAISKLTLLTLHLYRQDQALKSLSSSVALPPCIASEFLLQLALGLNLQGQT